MSYCVFFDLDETLVNTKTMLAVVKEYFIQNSFFKFFGEIRYKYFKWRLTHYKKKNPDRFSLNRFFYSQFSGISKIKMAAASVNWFNKNVSTIFNSEVLSELRKHKNLNANIFIITGSFLECVKPILKYLSINNVICTRLHEVNGIYSGKMTNGPIIGDGKKKAILEYVKQHRLSLKGSYAYADHHTDIPLLSLVNHPIVVNPNKKLLAHAKKKKWQVIVDKE